MQRLALRQNGRLESAPPTSKHSIIFTLICLAPSISIEQWYSPMVLPVFHSISIPLTLHYMIPQQPNQAVVVGAVEDADAEEVLVDEVEVEAVEEAAVKDMNAEQHLDNSLVKR